MPKTEQNLTLSKEFVRQVLLTSFGQTVDDEVLKQAAEKVCKALPTKKAA